MYLRTQLLAAVAVSMGLFVVGFSFGYSYHAAFRILESTMKKDFENKINLINNIILYGAIPGSLLGALPINYIGRRYSFMGTAVLLFIGWILTASASNSSVLLAGRALCGISTGVLSSAFPVYIVETAQSEVRGALGLLPTAFLHGGILLAQFLGAYLDWSIMAYIGAVISVPFFLLMFAVPDSPRWYIAKGRTRDAREALQWLRGIDYNIEDELQDLRQFQLEADKTKGYAVGQMFYIENIPAVFIALALKIFLSLNGIFAIYYYAQIAFATSSDKSDKHSFTYILGIINLVGIFVAIILIDKIGRKILMYISSICLIMSFVSLAACAYFFDHSKASIGIGWLLKVCVILNVLGTSIGYEPISSLILGEILPLKIRGTAASIIAGIFWICTVHMGLNSINILSSSDVYGITLIFVSIHVAQVLFVVFGVPETRGKSLEEIELNLTQRVKAINHRNIPNVDTTSKLI